MLIYMLLMFAGSFLFLKTSSFQEDGNCLTDFVKLSHEFNLTWKIKLE